MHSSHFTSASSKAHEALTLQCHQYRYDETRQPGALHLQMATSQGSPAPGFYSVNLKFFVIIETFIAHIFVICENFIWIQASKCTTGPAQSNKTLKNRNKSRLGGFPESPGGGSVRGGGSIRRNTVIIIYWTLKGKRVQFELHFANYVSVGWFYVL